MPPRKAASPKGRRKPPARKSAPARKPPVRRKPPTDPLSATEWARAVVAGRVVAGPHVIAACRRHLSDLRTGPKRGLRFDKHAAAAAVYWIQDLRLTSGQWAGRNFILLGWQRFIVESIYGWQRVDSSGASRRRFRRAFVCTGKGSGKTPLAAAMAVGAICADGERRAEGYIFARTAEQAAVTFRECAAFALEHPELGLHVTGGTRPFNISHQDSMSFLRQISSDSSARGKSGLRPSFVIADELHEHDTADMLDWLAAGVKDRAEPIVLITTNAGAGKASPCGVEYDLAVSIAAGDKINDSYFAFIACLDEGDKPWEDEGCWIKANPSLPDVPGLDYLRDQAETARGMPGRMASHDRLAFCKWTDAISPWIDATKWMSAEVSDLSPVAEREAVPCYGGLDLSLKTDLTSLALAWGFADRIEIEVQTWTPEETLDARANTDRAPYRTWVEQGWMATTPGAVISYDQVASWIRELVARWPLLKGIAYDPALISMLEAALDNAGVRASREPAAGSLRLIPHAQGFVAGMRASGRGDGLWMPRSISALEEAILQGRLRSLPNPLLRAALMGCSVVADASSNRRFNKARSTTRIDPAVAMTMAVGYLDVDPSERPFVVSDLVFPELYETGGKAGDKSEVAGPPAGG